MKNFIDRIFFLVACIFGKQKIEYFEFFSKKSRKEAVMNGNLDLAEERANSLEHFESDFEQWEQELEGADNLEELESYFDELESEGLESEYAERKMKRRFGRRGTAYSRLRKRGRAPKRGKLTTGLGAIKAQFTVNVTRNSFNIPFSLPIELFNSVDSLCACKLLPAYLNNNDLQILFSYIDASINNFVFVFKQISTGLQDTITVSCNEVPYVKLIVSLQTDYFSVAPGSTMQISDETQQIQFKQRFELVTQSVFGKGGNNPVNIAANIRPVDFRKDIVSCQIGYKINKETGIIMNMAYVAGAPLGYTLSVNLNMNVNYFSLHTGK